MKIHFSTMEKLKSQKMMEIKQKLLGSHKTRVFVANDLPDADLTVEAVENLDGVKPQVFIRIKRLVLRKRKR